MASRKTVLATGEVYHIFNRSIREIPIFKDKRCCNFFMEAMEYYLQLNPPIKFSKYRSQRNKYPLDLKNKVVNIFNFCLMPTHFHFTLRQEVDNGIRQFIQKLTNSFAHYFTLRYESKGPVFEGNFRAVRVQSNEQLLHLSRYIHLNPVTSYLVEKPEDYPFSSYLIYLGKEKSQIIDPSVILKIISPEDYQKFVQDQKDYQREFERIKHLILE